MRRQRLDERATRSPAPPGPVNRELVQKHLGAFVWVGHLDPGDEAHRLIGIVVGDEEVVVGVSKKARRRTRVARAVEEMLGGDNGPPSPWPSARMFI